MSGRPRVGARRARLLLGAALVVVLVAVALYVMRTTDTPIGVRVGSGATDAFDRRGQLDNTIRRAVFSPDGNLLAGISGGSVGLVRRGRLAPLTEPGSAVVDTAWMPDAKSLLVVEGPAAIERVTVIDLEGQTKGVADLDTPFSAGNGLGLTVDGRGARAVAVAESRDAIGGRRRHDLVLIDLPTGRVTRLTETADVDETAPVFVDDDRVLFARAEGTRPSAVIELNLASGAERRVSVDEDEAARPVGVIRGTTPVYAAGRSGDSVSVWAVLEGGRRERMGRVRSGAVVWSVDPAGTVAVATVPGDAEAADGATPPQLRAVTLNPPSSR